MNTGRSERRGLAVAALAMVVLAAAADGPAPKAVHERRAVPANASLLGERAAAISDARFEPPPGRPSETSGFAGPTSAEVVKAAQTVGMFALLSLVPAAVLMVTSFVRISIVLTLLRQALGSPQVPGNQVLTALALLLTALVMKPEAEAVYTRAVEPYAAGKLGAKDAWRAAEGPIKTFMIHQIHRTHHEHYLRDLYEYAVRPAPGDPEPEDCEQLPFQVVAPAYLLSELTTALFIGFLIYLPFLVIDLVVSAVLAAMGLVMLPPSLAAMPLKLVVFVLADGWWLVASTLLKSFEPAASAAGPG